MSYDYPKVAIYGTGGHGSVVEEILSLAGVPVAGFLDPRSQLHGTMIHGHLVLGSEDLFHDEHPSFSALTIAVGRASVRMEIAAAAEKSAIPLFSAIHPASVLSPTARIGGGTVVAAGAVVGPHVRIGANVIINTNASVDHDCTLEDFVHIAPGATLCGAVTVERAAWVGAGATVVEGVTIGEGSMVGAGAVVVEDVPPHTLVLGVPARKVRHWHIR